MKKGLFILLALVLATGNALGQKGREIYDRAARSARADLKRSLDKLERRREEISEAKVPISQDLLRLRAEVLSLRREMERSIQLRDNRTVDLHTIEKEIAKRKDEASYLSSLLGDYVQRFENQYHISEDQLYGERVKEARNVREDATLTDEEKLNKQVSVIQMSLDRIRNLAGGAIFEGKALSPTKTQEKGKFAMIGPIVLFSSDESDTTGFVVLEYGSAQPSVVQAEEVEAAGIREVSKNGRGLIPVDPTLGDALKYIATKETVLQHVEKGQIVGYFILGLAALALTIAIIKWIEISGVRRARPEDLQTILDMLRDGKKEEALAKAKSISGPVGLLLTDAVEHSEDTKDLLDEVLYERLLATQPKLERMIPFIAVVAATAPLMGLLGTVTGMIKTFKLITVFGTGDAKSLSSGISEALVTTEFGLCVAIPAIIIHALLLRRTRGVLASMEQTAVAFKNGLETKLKA